MSVMPVDLVATTGLNLPHETLARREGEAQRADDQHRGALHRARPGPRRLPGVDVRQLGGGGERLAAPGRGHDAEERGRRTQPRRWQVGGLRAPRHRAHGRGAARRDARPGRRGREPRRRVHDRGGRRHVRRGHGRWSRRARRTSAACRRRQAASASRATPTAAGVYAGLLSTLEEVFGSRAVAGRRVTVLGLGHVGSIIAMRLAREGAVLTVTDVNPAKRTLADALGATLGRAGRGARCRRRPVRAGRRRRRAHRPGDRRAPRRRPWSARRTTSWRTARGAAAARVRAASCGRPTSW